MRLQSFVRRLGEYFEISRLASKTRSLLFRSRLRPRRSVETLEPRALLAAVSWDGGAGTVNWTDAVNWSNNAVPTSADDVTIGAFNVTLGSSVTLNSLTLSGSVLTVSSSLSIAADQMAIGSTASIAAATRTVTLLPRTNGRQISLGGVDSGTQLGLTDTELDRITAGTIAIGSSQAGTITVSAPISALNTSTVALISGSSIAQSGSGAIIETNLALSAAGSISLPTANTVSSLAVSTSGPAAGSVTFLNSAGMAIGAIAGVPGISVANGAASLTLTTGNLTVANASAASDLSASQGVSITLNGSGASFILSAGADVSATANGVSVTADNIDLGTTTGGTISAPGQIVTLKPKATSRSVVLGGTSAAAFNLVDAEIDRVACSSLVIGSNTAGVFSVNSALTVNNELTLSSSNNINFTGRITMAANTSFSGITSGSVVISGTGAGVGVTGTGSILLNAGLSVAALPSDSLVSENGAIQILSNQFLSGAFTSITTAGSNAIRISGTADLSMTGDWMDLAAGSITVGTNSVSIRPKTLTLPIKLGSTDTSTNLGISSTELSGITAGRITIGSVSHTGTISVNSAMTVSQSELRLIAGGSASIAFAGTGALVGTSSTTISLELNSNGTGGITSGTALTDIHGHIINVTAGSGGIGTSAEPLAVESLTSGVTNGQLSASSLNAAQYFANGSTLTPVTLGTVSAGASEVVLTSGSFSVESSTSLTNAQTAVRILSGATLSGAASLDGQLIAEGTLNPGDSSGAVLSVLGQYVQSATGIQTVTLTSGPSQSLTVGGNVSVAGTLSVNNVIGTAPRGTVWRVLTRSSAGAISGAFSNVDADSSIAGTQIRSGSGYFTIDYQGGDGNDVDLRAIDMLPQATADVFYVSESQSVGAAGLLDVTANDIDTDGDALSLLRVGQPSHGVATIESGKIRYVPTNGYLGTDTFRYYLSDGHGGEVSAFVTVRIREEFVLNPASRRESAELRGRSLDSNTSGMAVVVWQDHGASGNTSRIVAQRLNSASGMLTGTEITVAESSPGIFNLQAPAVSVAADGSFLVVWEDLSTQSLMGRLFASDGSSRPRINGSGQNLGTSPFSITGTYDVVPSSTLEARTHWSIDAAPNGDAVVVWEGSDGSGDVGIFAVHLTASGMFKPADVGNVSFDGERFAVALGASMVQPSVTIDANQHSVIVWLEDSITGDSVQRRRFQSDTAPVGITEAVFVAETAGQNILNPTVRAGGSGSVVVWQYESVSGNLFAKRYDTGGLELLAPPSAPATIGNAFLIDVASSLDSAPALAVADTGEFSVSWTEDNVSVFVHEFSSDGDSLGVARTINSLFDEVEAAQVISAPGGRFLVAWNVFDDTGSPGVPMARVVSSGQQSSAWLDENGNLFLADQSLDGVANEFIVSHAGGSLIISDATAGFTADSVGYSAGQSSLTIPVTLVSGQIYVRSGAGDDRLTVWFDSNEPLTRTIHYLNGASSDPSHGSSLDQLVTEGTASQLSLSFATNTLTSTGGWVVAFPGSPSIEDYTAAGAKSLTFGDTRLVIGDGSETFTVSDTTSTTTVTSSLGMTATMKTPTDLMTIVGSTAFNDFDVTSWRGLNSALQTTVSAGSFGGNLYAGGDISLSPNHSVTFNVGEFTLAPDVKLTTSGSGSIEVNAYASIALSSGSRVATENGDVTLTANSTGTSGSNANGIDVRGATIEATGTGSIALSGRGTSVGNGDWHGVVITNSATGPSLVRTQSGDITISGTGGSSASLTRSAGVNLEWNSPGSPAPWPGSTIQTSSGNIVINGTGGANTGTAGAGVVSLTNNVLSESGSITIIGNGNGTGSSPGVALVDGQITTAGSVSITGRGTLGQSNQEGVLLNNTDVLSSSGITISGDAGGNGTDGGTGVDVVNSLLATTDTASILVTGVTRVNTGDQSTGLILQGSTELRTADGDIRLNGTAANSTGGGLNRGIVVDENLVGFTVTVRSTGDGDITMVGQSGTAAGTNNSGIDLEGVVSVVDGDISLTGTGGSSAGGFNYGILCYAQVNATGVGNISLTGTGGQSTLDGDGVSILSGASVTTVSGNITLNGTATATAGTTNDGVSIEAGNSLVRVTGTGTLLITGQTTSAAPAVGYGLDLGGQGPASIDVASGGATMIANTLLITPANATVNLHDGTLNLQTFTANRTISLGGADSATQLGISDAELDVITAARLIVGTSTGGAIANGGAISPAGIPLIRMNSGSTVAGNLTVPEVAVSATGGVTLTLGSATTLAATTQSNLNVTAPALTIGVVDGLIGVTAGNTTLRTDDIDILQRVSSSGSIGIRSLTLDRSVDLGTETAGRLSITPAEFALLTTDDLVLGWGSQDAIYVTGNMIFGEGIDQTFNQIEFFGESIYFTDGVLDANGADVYFSLGDFGTPSTGVIRSGTRAFDLLNVGYLSLWYMWWYGTIGEPNNPLSFDADTLYSFSSGDQYLKEANSVYCNTVTSWGPGSGISLEGGGLFTGGTVNGSNAPDFFDVGHGTSLGAAAIYSTLTNHGEVFPGKSLIGTVPSNDRHVFVDGDYSQSTDGSFHAELGGATAGVLYSQMEVTGLATLAGSLVVSLVEGFIPTYGQQFTIIRRSGSDGSTFEGLPELALLTAGDATFQIDYHGGDGNDVVLTRVFGVTNTNDSGKGSLRQAIEQANAYPVLPTETERPGIWIQIPGAGPHVIQVTSPLPQITRPVMLTAERQVGYTGLAPMVEVRGPGALGLPTFVGFNAVGGSVSIHCISITGFSDAVVMDTGYGGVFSSWVGISADGIARGNAGTGVTAASDMFFVMNSVISGNQGDGILATSSTLDFGIDNTLIGLSPDGTQAMPNAGHGLSVIRDDSLSVVSYIAVDNSTISGNLQGGVFVADHRTDSGPVVEYILEDSSFGVNPSRSLAIPNQLFGIRVEKDIVSPLNRGAGLISRNVISGNNGPGIQLLNAGFWVAEDNLIGTDGRGSYAIPNETGIDLRNPHGPSAYPSYAPGERRWHGNLISGNRGDGVHIAFENVTYPGPLEFQGNFHLYDGKIGTDTYGLYSVPNQRGVFIDYGGAEVHYHDVYLDQQISGNNGPGIEITGTDTTADFGFVGYLGADSSGSLPLSNRGAGLLVRTDSVNTWIEAGSVIAFNRGAGIKHEGLGSGQNISLEGNTNSPVFFGNQGLAIDLGSPGPTSPSSLLTDVPLLVSASYHDGFLDITGSNTPGSGPLIQFYSTRPTISGRGQGETQLGFFGVLAGSPLPARLQSDLQTWTDPLRDLDLRNDQFRFRIEVGDELNARLLTAVFVDPYFGEVPEIAGVSEFSQAIPIGTQLTHLPPEVEAGPDLLLQSGESLNRVVTFRDDDSVSFEVVVDYGDGQGFEYAMYRPQDRTITLEHTYPSAGQYLVSVSVLDDSTPVGLIDIDSFLVTVQNSLPEVRFNEVSLTKRVIEGELVSLSGTFEDADILDLHTVEVDWGDGTFTPPSSLPVGSRAFSLQHNYVDDGISGAGSHVYRVIVTIRDEAGATSATPVFLVQVDNVLPAWNLSSPGPLRLSQTSISEGDEITLFGQFNDPGLVDTHRVVINWGDGTKESQVPAASIHRIGTQLTFSIPHRYNDNPLTGTQFPVTVRLSDDDDPTTAVDATTTITVSNVTPVIQPLTAGSTVMEEGTLQSLFVEFADSGRELHTVMVAWGDGSPEQSYEVAAGQSSKVLSYRYDRDGVYTISARVADRDGVLTNTETVTFTVTNRLPSLSITSQSNIVIAEGDEVIISGVFDDESPMDFESLLVTWGDGTPAARPVVNRAAGTWTARHRYADDAGGAAGSRDFPIHVTVDDGTDTVLRTTSVKVQNLKPGIDVVPIAESGTSNLILTAFGTDISSEDQSSLVTHWSVTQGGSPISFIQRSATVIELDFNVIAAATAGSSLPVIVTAWTQDNDGGQSDAWSTGLLFGSTGNDHITVTNAHFNGGLNRLLVFGGDGADVLDATGVTTTGLSVVLYGGAGNDLLFDGAGNDVSILGYGNDALNVPLNDSRNAFVDSFGTPFQITPDMRGDDEIYMIVNSVLEAWDNVGDNGLNFSLNESSVIQSSGITFDLSLTQQTSLGQTLVAQDVVPGSVEPATHFAGALGRFVRLTGSNYGDHLTGASQSTVWGGTGDDEFFVKTGMRTVTFHGGSDDDVLQNLAGTDILGIVFGGDDGSDLIVNAGSLGDVTFTGGADDDIIQNMAGADLLGVVFGGDDGADLIVNAGSLGDVTFTGGADDDIIQNMAGADLLDVVFGGDDGADLIVNAGTLGDVTFTGGADDDVIRNLEGADLLSIVFGGDDGADLIVNAGSLGDVTFTGGADDDIIQNMAGADLLSIVFGGDDGADLIVNAGSLGDVTFTGGADDDIIQNMAGADLLSIVFGGDDGADLIVNAGSLGDVTFTGGADDDIIQNMAGADLLSIVFGGDDGADLIVNAGSLGDVTFTGGADDDIIRNLEGADLLSIVFGGDDGSDLIVNAGSLGDVTFTGGADDDVIRNLEGADLLSIVFGGDDGSDLIVNAGSLGDVTFTGGADDDIIQNMAGADLLSIVFGGDDGADLIVNAGTLGDVTFTGGADDDIIRNLEGADLLSIVFGGDDGSDLIVNAGSLGDVTFTGGADDDIIQNLEGADLLSIVFGGDDGSDLIVNAGSLGDVTFTGGADDDIIQNMAGADLLDVVFGGDDGADLIVNAGTLGDVTFTGGADGDVLQTLSHSVLSGTFSFDGGIGADILVNRSSTLTRLVFAGGSEDDILINSADGLGDIVFGGDVGNDVFVNWGNAGSAAARPGSTRRIVVNAGDGSNAMRNEGSGWQAVSYLGGANEDFFQNNASGIGQLSFDGGLGRNAFENNASRLASIEFAGSAGADTFANDGNQVGAIVFNAGNGDNVLINSGTDVSGIQFSGGTGNDRFLNYGYHLTNALFDAGAGSDVLIQRGSAANGLTFRAGAGADVWILEAGASGSSDLRMEAGDDDDARDLLIIRAALINGLFFDGGAGDDDFRNDGYMASNVLFAGGTGNDRLQNRGWSADHLTFDGGEGNDTFENRGPLGGLIEFLAGDGNDIYFQSAGSASEIVVDGGSGNDVLQNFGNDVQVIRLIGGTGDDSLISSGSRVGLLELSGGTGNNLLRNFGSQIGHISVVWSGDSLTSSDVVQNTGNTIQQITVVSGNMTTVNSEGHSIQSIDVTGSAGADTVTVSGDNIQTISFVGGAGNDGLHINVTSSLTSSADFIGDDGADMMVLDGTLGNATFLGGEGSDSVLMSANVVYALFAGGDGDDFYHWIDSPSGDIVIEEVFGGLTDTSADVLDFSAYLPGAVSMDLSLTAPQSLPDGLTLTLADGMGIENLVGTRYADELTGNARNNIISGAQYRIGPGSGSPAAAWTREQWVLLDFTSRTTPGEFLYGEEDIAAIRQRLQSIYLGLPVHFVMTSSDIPQTLRDSNSYVTIYFNDTPDTGRPGGESSEIDPGNLNLGGTAQVQISGLLGGREVFAPDAAEVLAAAGELDGDEIQAPDFPKPLSTGNNLRALSAKIAAHELAHLLGLRHYDAFGPIGYGIHTPPGGQQYTPFYVGPGGAYETTEHILSSPASSGTTRFNDLRTLYFGEREALKLALAFSDPEAIITTETVSTHGSLTTAMPVTLSSLQVPSLAVSGFSLEKRTLTDAQIVHGTIGLQSGHSENDWYSFTGQAGDLLTLEVLSKSLARYNSERNLSIDPVIRVYLPSGQLLQTRSGDAVNDDEFESSDSVLSDLLLPESGLYFVEIDTFRRLAGDADYDIAVTTMNSLLSRLNDTDPTNDLSDAEFDLLGRLEDSLNDTDVGSYELIMYRTSRESRVDDIDVLQGMIGTDILVGGPDDDYSIGIDLTGPLNLSEGSDWNGILQFTDRGGFSWQVTVDFGNGQSWTSSSELPLTQIPLVQSYDDDGLYEVIITISNDDGLSTVKTWTLTVTNVAPSAEIDGLDIGVTGYRSDFELFASDPAGAADPLSWNWVISRGTTTIMTQAGGDLLSWIPSEAGVYRISVTVSDDDGGTTVVSRDITVLTAARVVSTVIENGAVQRSMVRQLTVTFDRIVEVLPGAFTVLKRGAGSVALQTPVVSVVSGRTVVTLRFMSGAYVAGGGSLADGNYELRINAGAVLFHSAPLDGDGDGLSGGNLVFGDRAEHNFFRLAGDGNGDRVVNAADGTLFNLTYRKLSNQVGFNSAFDFDGDGDVDSLDYLFMRSQINKTMAFF